MKPMSARTGFGVWVAMVAGIAAVVATEGRAQAGACPEPQVSAIPADEATGVPTDAEVRLFFGERHVRAYELRDPTSRSVVKDGTADAATATVKLRVAGKPDVDLTLRRIDATQPVLIAKPKRVLDGGTTYAVVLVTDKDSFVISHFTTGQSTTTESAKLDAASGKMFTWRIPHADWKDPSGSFAEVTTRGAHGAGFEVYELAPDEQPSDAKLRVVVPGVASKFRFGSVHGCGSPDFTFDEPAKSPRRLSLAVRTYDDAGNASPIVRFSLDLKRRASAH
jgi:hypothetical protein